MKEKFSITKDAESRITHIMDMQNDKGLRIIVCKGGCHGLKYKFSFEDQINNQDLIFKKGKAVVMVENASMEFLKDCSLDYKEDLSGANFVVKNPNAKEACECGSSFSL